MLKIIFLMASAFSYPGAGDHATYEGCVMREGKCIHFFKEQQILSIQRPQNIVTIVWRYREGDEGPQAKVKTLHEKEFQTPARFQEIMAKCKGRDAQYIFEAIKITVPAGSFQTCKRTTMADGTTVYLGDVPFGFVKVVSAKLNYELISFRDGMGAP